jgi:hypothetical protein
MFAKRALYHFSHSTSPFCVEIWSQELFPWGWLWTVILCISASWMLALQVWATSTGYFFFLLLYWGCIVAFTNILTIYHSWIHPFSPHSWNNFNKSHFSILIREYILFHRLLKVSCYIAQAGLKLLFLMPQPLEYYNCRHAPPCLAL